MMSSELDKKLVKAFPNLYADRNASMKETAMCWGFECGNGWFELIWNLSQALEKLILLLPEEERSKYRAWQVKKKYGSLRFYMTYTNAAMSKLINKAEDDSEKICEVCGEPGTLNNVDNWISCRCKKCRSNET